MVGAFTSCAVSNNNTLVSGAIYFAYVVAAFYEASLTCRLYSVMALCNLTNILSFYVSVQSIVPYL